MRFSERSKNALAASAAFAAIGMYGVYDAGQDAEYARQQAQEQAAETTPATEEYAIDWQQRVEDHEQRQDISIAVTVGSAAVALTVIANGLVRRQPELTPELHA